MFGSSRHWSDRTSTNLRRPTMVVAISPAPISSYSFVRPRPVAAQASAIVQVRRCANGILVSIVASWVATTDERRWVMIFCSRSEAMVRMLRKRKSGFEFGKARSQCGPQRMPARKSAILRAPEGHRREMARRIFLSGKRFPVLGLRTCPSPGRSRPSAAKWGHAYAHGFDLDTGLAGRSLSS